MAQLQFRSGFNGDTSRISQISILLIGTGSDSDIATGGITLFDDSGSVPGNLDSGDQEIASGSPAGGYVTLNPTANLQVDAGGVNFFLTINIATGAVV